MPQTDHLASATIDSIIDQLNHFHQRATYGAVAGVLNASPRNLMTGRSRSQRDSWIVAHGSGLPTGYSPDQVHPEIGSHEQILSTAKDLSTWLESPS